MGPEVIVFAVGLYLGWLLFVLSAVLTIPQRTRRFALPVLALGIVAGVIGELAVEWGVPWYVSFAGLFATVAIPTGIISCAVALVASVHSWKGVKDAV
jgi:hypothetical protein